MTGKKSSKSGKGMPPTKITMDGKDNTHIEDDDDTEVVNESSNGQISSDSNGNSGNEGGGSLEENLSQNPPRDSQTGSKDWTAEDEGQLVEMWRSEEYLYNKALPDYRNALKKDIAIKRIATNLNKEFSVVKTHMESLRSTYGRVKEIKSGSGRDALSVRKRNIKHMLSFLYDHVKPRETHSNHPKRKKTHSPRKIYPSRKRVQRFTRLDSPDHEMEEGKIVPKVSRDSDSNDIQDNIDEFSSPSPKKKKPNEKSSQSHTGKPKEKTTTWKKSGVREIMYRTAMRPLTPPRRRIPTATVTSANAEQDDPTLASLATSVSTMASTYTDKATPFNKHITWGQLLGEKVWDMDENVREAFKLEVDMLAFKALNGTFKPSMF